MGSGGESEQDSKSAPSKPLQTNPLGIAFGELFGQNFGFDPSRAGFVLAGDDPADYVDKTANQIFNADSFNVLTDQLDPVANSPFGDLATQNMLSMNDLFQNELIPGATEMANTGFRTDLDPIIKQQMAQFQNQMVPELANQFGFLGGGGQNRLSSDFGAATANAAGGIATNLGSLQVDADEAAAGRRAEGIGLAGELSQLSAAFPAALGSDILSLNEQNFDQTLLGRPGGQLMNLLNNLMGVTQPDPILGQVSAGGGMSSNIGVL
jgi:hypothetical protein